MREEIALRLTLFLDVGPGWLVVVYRFVYDDGRLSHNVEFSLAHLDVAPRREGHARETCFFGC